MVDVAAMHHFYFFLRREKFFPAQVEKFFSAGSDLSLGTFVTEIMKEFYNSECFRESCCIFSVILLISQKMKLFSHFSQ